MVTEANADLNSGVAVGAGCALPLGVLLVIDYFYVLVDLDVPEREKSINSDLKTL